MSLVDDFFSGSLRPETQAESTETRVERYSRSMAHLLSPMSAPWPSDGFPNMADRVAAVAKMTVLQRVECMIKARDTPPDYLTNLERRQWLEGMGQIGG